MTKPPIPCDHCGQPVEQPLVGRPKRFCNPACKQAHWRKTHKPEATPVEVVPDDTEALLDLDAASIAVLRAELMARDLDPTGDRETLIRRILSDDGVEVEDVEVEPEPEEGDEEALTEPTPAPLRKWLADPAAPTPRPAPAPRPRPRIRESW